VLSAKYFNLPSPRTHPLDETIHLFRFSTGLSHFRDNNIRVKPSVRPRRHFEVTILVRDGFDSDEHVFLGMIQPVTSTSGAYDPLKLSFGVYEKTKHCSFAGK
jgi:hypothetical protein